METWLDLGIKLAIAFVICVFYVTFLNRKLLRKYAASVLTERTLRQDIQDLNTMNQELRRLAAAKPRCQHCRRTCDDTQR